MAHTGRGPTAEEMAARAQGLADPLRLAALDLLATGPRTASELAVSLGVSGSRLSNHLAVLREAGLVSVTRQSRQAVYALRGEGVRRVLAALRTLTAGEETAPEPVEAPLSPITLARACYGHLAGRLGVAVFDHLAAAGAIAAAGDRVEVLAAAPDAFARLGVDLGGLAAGRRRLAYPCLDWSENRPHLGGVLGDALLDGLLERGLLRRREGTRALEVTPDGDGLFRSLVLLPSPDAGPDASA
ncbi:ArsR/SmtB family transcription factor [Microbispora sp. ATCC PTA-5024]|uniref:ArsR/SmtB family transcription factor n=1 Tax=Microbispora sp. ATCC PTA-5024 TaxID=316330 RepID=UPI0003DD9BED|nr:helix-turn-helix domain-containing protein [Microbispora sp. ATCC PTA-5024]ETK37855.1 hypothetical protein MPTA5024_01760 [Microbispora sp. ATCC PTA-5024]